MAFQRSDAERLAGANRNVLTISSAGPSGLSIQEKAKVKRAPRQRKVVALQTEADDCRDALPFAPK